MMVNLKVKANTLGKMALSTLVNLKMVLSTVPVDGKVEKDLSATNMKETTVKIKNKVMVYSPGLVEISTKESIRKTKEMVMER